MTMNRHEPFEELISASLHGDLSADERRQLDAHLDGCPACRDTLAAFAEQRRIVAGVRYLAPPRDLGARVRAGIEGGSPAGLPWWRRPIAIFTTVGGGLAVVTGVLLALVMLNGTDEPNVGRVSPTPSMSVGPATPVPQATLSPITDPEVLPTPIPSGETPAPSASPPENPLADASPEPDLYLAIAPSESQVLTVREGSTDDLVTEPVTPPGPPATPIAAELTSDGQWLAYISDLGLTGMTEVRATRVGEGRTSDDPDATPPPDSTVAVGDTIVLGTSVAGSPFLEHLAWSGDGRHLAFTLADPAGGGTDVWIFEAASGEFWQLTDVGDAYAGSWVSVGRDDGDDAVDALWVSRAEGAVTSYLSPVTDGSNTRRENVNPADEALATAERVFQPLLTPNRGLAIYWDGTMTRAGDEWVFVEGGAPFLAEHKPGDAGELGFENERPLFSDVVIDRDAFTSAAISWGPDGNSYAVWDTVWTGLPQAAEGEYPDRSRVYFGHAIDPRGLTRVHALDQNDLPTDGRVVDVKVSPTGAHLVIMFAYPVGGELEAPRADLILVKRNTGEVPDDVETLRDGGWNGPAAFDAYTEIEAP
jgi:hypothetical protein